MSTSGDVAMASLVEGLGKLGITFWEYGRAFLWGCAGAAVLVFAVLYGGKYFGFSNAGEVFATIGLWVLIAFVIFTALATARTLEGRAKKTLFFVSNEEQSLWGQARQQPGYVTTNFNFRMAVTNVSEGSVHLSKPRIVWPLRARFSEHMTAVLITENNVTFHGSQEFPIQPHQRGRVSGVIMVRGCHFKAGKRLNFTVSVVDHEGRRYRVKFKHVRAANDKPV
jgi:hypothetical protein